MHITVAGTMTTVPWYSSLRATFKIKGSRQYCTTLGRLSGTCTPWICIYSAEKGVPPLIHSTIYFDCWTCSCFCRLTAFSGILRKTRPRFSALPWSAMPANLFSMNACQLSTWRFSSCVQQACVIRRHRCSSYFGANFM